ncbi:MAG: hypothetical protein ACP5MI_00295 [Candidatus Kryptoniota bacterium]
MKDKAVVVVSRTPLPKEVKTNFVPPLTMEEAAELHASLLFDLAERLALEVHAHPYIYFEPADARSDFEHVFRHASFDFKLRPATGNRYSDRAANAIENVFSEGNRRVIFADVDAALLPINIFRHTYELLNLDDDVIVLAPDPADHLNLIGVKKPHLELFDSFNSGNPFETAMKISSPLNSMLFTLERHYSMGDINGLRILLDRFEKDGHNLEHARRVSEFLHTVKDRYGKI